jgi:hypothetical protein
MIEAAVVAMKKENRTAIASRPPRFAREHQEMSIIISIRAGS